VIRKTFDENKTPINDYDRIILALKGISVQ
jgi:hypothetical protein